MAKRKQATSKNPVRIRAKFLKDGCQSLYLDIRNDGVRSYRFLHLYLMPAANAESRKHNTEVMKQAEKAKEELTLELTYARAGLEDRSFKAGIRLIDWMKEYERYQEKNGSSKSFRYNISSTRKYLEAFDNKIQLNEVDGKFIDSFIGFMKTQTTRHCNETKPLSHNTVCCRIRTLSSALNYAVSRKLIACNPCLDAETRMGEVEKRREYLTVEEVKRLIVTPCPSKILKRAFLFSVFCGLRLSDVRSLTWRNIVKDGNHWRAEVRQQKTQSMLYLPLNIMARKWILEPPNHNIDDKIFKGLGSSNKSALSQWMDAAGIKKQITYHSSRHSFAVMALHAGVDIYTVSKLMGHASIHKTQVYANIMNGRKQSTVSLLDSVLD